ncbi:SMP-30/gluconolactonase/LRE family protein [Rubripirellula lacrimiformis]|nr:SMP-30/gluconolactonase/LRE family protein [Rubripirellula lacrimiformis]
MIVANDLPTTQADDAVFAGPPKMLLESGAGEGPVWNPKIGLLTSFDGNIHLRDANGNSSIYRENSGSNGLLFDREGRLIVCEATRHRVTRTERDGTIVVLADQFNGMKFNQPNDLTIDTQGRIYFSDPQYGDRSQMEMKDDDGKLVEGVYRIDVDGTVSRVIDHQVDRPNGLIITPDDQFMYVADNNNALGGARKLYRFEMRADGSVDTGSQTLIHDWGTTRGPDGMKLDQQGNLYVAAGLNQPHLPQETADQPTAGIYVFSKLGKQVAFVKIPRDETTNCAFGGDDGKTLFVTAGGSLWAIPTVNAGYQID